MVVILLLLQVLLIQCEHILRQLSDKLNHPQTLFLQNDSQCSSQHSSIKYSKDAQIGGVTILRAHKFMRLIFVCAYNLACHVLIAGHTLGT